jgi:hypothetical protein
MTTKSRETIDILVYTQGQGRLRPEIPSRGASHRGVILSSDPQVSFDTICNTCRPLHQDQ